jgi:hypothetical protein
MPERAAPTAGFFGDKQAPWDILDWTRAIVFRLETNMTTLILIRAIAPFPSSSSAASFHDCTRKRGLENAGVETNRSENKVKMDLRQPHTATFFRNRNKKLKVNILR